MPECRISLIDTRPRRVPSARDSVRPLHSFVRISDTFKGSGAASSPTNLLKRIEFTNSQSLQLFVAVTPSTTVPQRQVTPVTSRVGPQGSVVTTAAALPAAPATRSTQSGAGATSLAFTGSNSSGGALLGLGSFVVGGAALAIGGQRRRYDRKAQRGRRARRHGSRVRPSLWVSLPND
jgi:hypothetical protein